MPIFQQLPVPSVGFSQAMEVRASQGCSVVYKKPYASEWFFLFFPAPTGSGFWWKAPRRPAPGRTQAAALQREYLQSADLCPWHPAFPLEDQALYCMPGTRQGNFLQTQLGCDQYTWESPSCMVWIAPPNSEWYNGLSGRYCPTFTGALQMGEKVPASQAMRHFLPLFELLSIGLRWKNRTD